MNALLASLGGFAVGVLFAYGHLRLWGGVMYATVRAVFNREQAPGVETSSHAWAELACLAHARILDEAGHPGAAGQLVLAARHAPADPARHLMLSNRQMAALQDKYRAHFSQGALFMGASPGMPLDCHKHGPSRWDGHVRCLKCERVYQLGDNVDNPAPPICACGYRLLPEVNAQHELLPATGNPCCRHCGEDAKTETPRKVAPPTHAEQMRPLVLIDQTLRWGQCPACNTELWPHFEGDPISPRGQPPEICPACGHKAEEVCPDCGHEHSPNSAHPTQEAAP